MGLFKGQVAWVTGAGLGIGRAAALMLAEQGASVALVSRTQSEVEQVAQEIRSRGGTSNEASTGAVPEKLPAALTNPACCLSACSTLTRTA